MPKQRKNGKSSGESTENKEVQIKIAIDVKPDTPFYYVNYLAVSHTPYDFSISALKLPSQLTSEQKQYAKRQQPVPMEPTLQLVIPVNLVKGLVRALNTECQKYEARFGKIPFEERGNSGKT
jgi:Protein of unknown function (DUF3467)